MDLQEYMEKEVLQHVTATWIGHSKTNVGYEINFTKHFNHYIPLHLTKMGKDLDMHNYLEHTTKTYNSLLRLPLHNNITEEDIACIRNHIETYFMTKNLM